MVPRKNLPNLFLKELTKISFDGKDYNVAQSRNGGKLFIIRDIDFEIISETTVKLMSDFNTKCL